jgi:superfamily II DNA or RNA helicase
MSSALTLRPYQEEAIAAIERALERGIRRPLIVLPTGCGKTCVFASLIARRGGSALVLAHREELLRQAAQKIAIADPTLALGVGFIAAERDDVGAPVVVASVQTLAQTRRLKRLPQQFDTIVVDECHHATARSYRRILAHLDPSPLIVGVTATPQRSDGKLLGEVWDEIVYQRAIAEMIRAGYLTDVRGIRVGLEQINLDQVAQSGGDYQADALGAALEQAAAPQHVLHAYRTTPQAARPWCSSRPSRSHTEWPRPSATTGLRRRRWTAQPRERSGRRSSSACKRGRRRCWRTLPFSPKVSTFPQSIAS